MNISYKKILIQEKIVIKISYFIRKLSGVWYIIVRTNFVGWTTSPKVTNHIHNVRELQVKEVGFWLQRFILSLSRGLPKP